MNLMNLLFGPPTKDQFAASVIAAFRQAGDPRKFQFDKEQFLLKESEGTEINLANFYIEHCQLPRSERNGQIQLIVQTFVSASEELPELFETARPNLRPKIWTRATFSEMNLRQRLNGGKPFESPLYPLGEHLLTAVVYDLPTSMRSLSNEDLEKWGVTYYEAMEIACDNLREESIAYSKIGDGFYSSVSGDAYDPARILLKDTVMSWEVEGDHVAMVPQRDAMYVTGSNDELGLKIMVDLAELSVKDGLRPLSPIPLRLVDGEWEDWKFPKSHPDYAKYHRLEYQYFGELYESQKALLDAIHEKEGFDVFVASFGGIKHQAREEVWSWSTWTNDCDSMLPKTDLIMLNLSGEPYPCKWDDVTKIVGNLMEPVEDLYPIRFRVRNFPSDEQVAQIPKFDL
jgi:hypothetical protein